MERIRIAYVVGSLTYGGSERQMLALAERLPRERYSVDFVLLGNPGPYAERAERAGARVTSLGARTRRDGSFVLFALRASVKAARYVRHMRRARYDIVDAWLFPSYGLAAVTRPLTGIPILISGRRSLFHFKERFGPLERLLDRLARRWTDVIVANSEAVAADGRRREGIGGDRLRVIHNGVERIEPPSPAERRAQRAAWHATDDDLVLGCVANYKEGKGHRLLLEALAAIVPEAPNVRLVLVGDGSLRPDLERWITELRLVDRVVLHGVAFDPGPLFSAFDIAVQASESEGLPNAVLEAAAAGRPIIATAVGGTAEIVDHERTGLLVPSNDTVKLAEAIRLLVADEDRRLRFGAAAQEHVLNAFGMERFVAEFAALYEELAMSKGFSR